MLRALQILAGRNQLDVIILAESPFEGQLRISGFSEAQTSLGANRVTGTRLEIYHRSTVAFPSFTAVERAVLHNMVVVASGQTLSLVSAHLDSALYSSDETRKMKIKELAVDIRTHEERNGHRRTVLVGDLNFDPHNVPIIGTDGLNAVAAKEIAHQPMRGTNRMKYPYFYNPMWTHLTDATQSPPGTYYRKTNDVDRRFWYLPDQVMIRPELLEYWQDNNLHILSSTGKMSLRDRQGRPHRKKFSDHLPLQFALNLP